MFPPGTQALALGIRKIEIFYKTNNFFFRAEPVRNPGAGNARAAYHNLNSLVFNGPKRKYSIWRHIH